MDTQFQAADGRSVLRGTVTVPAGDEAGLPSAERSGDGTLPGALLLVGSGPLDRDSNMKRQKLNITADLAAELAKAGVVTLRFDKRGAGASDGDFHATGFVDNIDDAELALAHLRAQPTVDADRVIVIGHSAGALIATEVARREQDRNAASAAIDGESASLAGIVLLAGAARNGRDVLTWQAAALSGSLPVPIRVLLRLLRTDLSKMQAKRLDKLARSTADSTRMQGVKINARWFREFMAFDPSVPLNGLTVPVLALTGEADVQVPPQDVAVMESLVAGPFEGGVLDDLSHLFRPDPDRRGVRGYRASIKEPLDVAVVDRLIDWLGRAVAPLAT
jgi:pimeloyl-ACP methyl ester carboxylesterase